MYRAGASLDQYACRAASYRVAARVLAAARVACGRKRDSVQASFGWSVGDLVAWDALMSRDLAYVYCPRSASPFQA